MKLGYIRESKVGSSVEEQRAALKAAGVTVDGLHPPLYIDAYKRRRKQAADDDPLPERTELFRRLRKQDQVVVASIGRLGLSSDDILAALAQIAERESTLLVSGDPTRYRYHPDAAAMARLAARGGQEIRAEIAANMRKSRNAGFKVRWTDGDYQRAKPIYFNPKLSNAEVAKESGIPYRTLYRQFGPRSPHPDPTVRLQRARRRK